MCAAFNAPLIFVRARHLDAKSPWQTRRRQIGENELGLCAPDVLRRPRTLSIQKEGLKVSEPFLSKRNDSTRTPLAVRCITSHLVLFRQFALFKSTTSAARRISKYLGEIERTGMWMHRGFVQFGCACLLVRCGKGFSGVAVALFVCLPREYDDCRLPALRRWEAFRT